MKTQKEKINHLVQRLSCRSDERAFDELFHIYYDRLLPAAFFILKSKDLAEEVVSDVFYRLWQNREKLSEVKNLDSYLFISIRNQSLNYLAREQKMRRDSLDELPDHIHTEEVTAEDLILASELQEKISKTIASLPPKCKEVFKMIRFEGLKYKEVADKLKVSVNTVDAQMGIAVKKMAEGIGYLSPRRKKKK